MKAILLTQYGPPDALEYKEIDKPTPKEHQVLVKVRAASANALDWRRFAMWPILARIFDGGFSKPKSQGVGADLAGVVEAVGEVVTDFKPGDEVFGVCGASFAEYALARDKNLVHKPKNVTFEEAAAVPVGALTALQGLRDFGKIQSGDKVMIYGASGSVGIFAIQIAKSFGAEVTAVVSTRNVEMAKSLGADHVIDYKQEDFTHSGQKYDLIFAVNGYRSIFDYRKALKPNGRYVEAGGKAGQILEGMALAPLVNKFGAKRMGMMGMASTPKADLETLREMLEAGTIKAVIDKTYPLSEAAAAIKYMMNEHARGKVIISVAQESS